MYSTPTLPGKEPPPPTPKGVKTSAIQTETTMTSLSAMSSLPPVRPPGPNKGVVETGGWNMKNTVFN